MATSSPSTTSMIHASPTGTRDATRTLTAQQERFLTTADDPSSASATLHARLKRAFLVARSPGLITQAVVTDPQEAAEVAIRIVNPAMETARLEERARCGRQIRAHAARLRGVAVSLNGFMVAEATDRAADLIDPQGPVQGARAMGGTE